MALSKRTQKALRGAAFDIGQSRKWLRNGYCRHAIAKLVGASRDLGIASVGFPRRSGTSELGPRFDALFNAFDRQVSEVTRVCDCQRKNVRYER